MLAAKLTVVGAPRCLGVNVALRVAEGPSAARAPGFACATAASSRLPALASATALALRISSAVCLRSVR